MNAVIKTTKHLHEVEITNDFEVTFSKSNVKSFIVEFLFINNISNEQLGDFVNNSMDCNIHIITEEGLDMQVRMQKLSVVDNTYQIIVKPISLTFSENN